VLLYFLYLCPCHCLCLPFPERKCCRTISASCLTTRPRPTTVGESTRPPFRARQSLAACSARRVRGVPPAGRAAASAGRAAVRQRARGADPLHVRLSPQPSSAARTAAASPAHSAGPPTSSPARILRPPLSPPMATAATLTAASPHPLPFSLRSPCRSLARSGAACSSVMHWIALCALPPSLSLSHAHSHTHYSFSISLLLSLISLFLQITFAVYLYLSVLSHQ
jgi:hypothetical protein